MNFFNKIEDLVNAFLLRMQELFFILVKKATPAKIKVLLEKVKAKSVVFKPWMKSRPEFLKTWTVKKFGEKKSLLASMDLQSKFKTTSKTSDAEVNGKLQKIKRVFSAPFLIIGQWIQGLSVLQSILLLGFSAASILAVVGIGFEGQRLLKHMKTDRAPASVDVEEAYARPDYYKKQIRHLDFTNIRLPVYIPQVNELRTIDIDFTATLSNRETKMWLAQREFQLRDHLILNMEPLTASFPLEDEGKEIIRQKLLAELNDYLVEHKREGHIVELKLTYVLAN